jgi:hypothetical protein
VKSAEKEKIFGRNKRDTELIFGLLQKIQLHTSYSCQKTANKEPLLHLSLNVTKL